MTTLDPRSPTTARYPVRALLADLSWKARCRALEARARRLLALELERAHPRLRRSEPPARVYATAREILRELPAEPAHVTAARREELIAADAWSRARGGAA